MKIYLVRHGHAAASWQESDDPCLSELGRQQAATASRSLAPNLDGQAMLLSSPMLRARETAQPLAEVMGTAVSIVEAFREIPTPVDRSERQAWLKSIARQSWDQQHDMVAAWRRSLLWQLEQIRQPAVVFTHFMVLNAIVSALTGNDRVICFLPDNASITTLRLAAGTWQLEELGRQLQTVIG